MSWSDGTIFDRRGLPVSAIGRNHPSGPGLVQIGREVWYGSFGGCDLCADTDEARLIPRAVRYWSPDDGWKVGVLCITCGEFCRERGPQPSDWAYTVDMAKAAIDAMMELGDEEEAVEIADYLRMGGKP
jgi:hypothetical protein